MLPLKRPDIPDQTEEAGFVNDHEIYDPTDQTDQIELLEDHERPSDECDCCGYCFKCLSMVWREFY